MKRSLMTLAGVLLGVAAASAQTAPGEVRASVTPPEPGGPSLTVRSAAQAADSTDKRRYGVRRGDSLSLDFSFAPEFNQTVTVEPDGYVSLKEVGSLRVEGQTVPQLVETLKAAYSGILNEPVLAITLKDFEHPVFFATGQLGKPGKYDLRAPITVTEAVAVAGGFNDSAKHSQVVLFHPLPNGLFEAKVLNVKQLVAKRDLNEDLIVQAGDLIYVPESRMAKIRKYLPQTAVGAYYNPTTPR